MPSCPVFYQTPPQAQEPELWQREGEILNLGFAPVCQGDEEEAPGRGLVHTEALGEQPHRPASSTWQGPPWVGQQP